MNEILLGLAIAMPFIFVALGLLYVLLTRPKDHLRPGE